MVCPDTAPYRGQPLLKLPPSTSHMLLEAGGNRSHHYWTGAASRANPAYPHQACRVRTPGLHYTVRLMGATGKRPRIGRNRSGAPVRPESPVGRHPPHTHRRSHTDEVCLSANGSRSVAYEAIHTAEPAVPRRRASQSRHLCVYDHSPRRTDRLLNLANHLAAPDIPGTPTSSNSRDTGKVHTTNVHHYDRRL